MCCNLSAAEWDGLLPPEMKPVDLVEEEDKEAAESRVEDSAAPSASSVGNPAVGPVTRSQQVTKRHDVGLKSHKVIYEGSFDCDEEVSHNRRLADITNTLRWEARVNGFSYFGADELRQCNENL
jgi:hypothetical protein